MPSASTDRRRRGQVVKRIRRVRRISPPRVALKDPRSRYLAVPWTTLEALERDEVRQVRMPVFATATPAFPAAGVGIIAWSSHPVLTTIVRTRLFTLVDDRIEPLGNADEIDLAAEGFADRAAFRQWWMEHTGKGFDPLLPTEVFTLRPLHDADIDVFAQTLLREVYGEHIDGMGRDHHVV